MSFLKDEQTVDQLIQTILVLQLQQTLLQFRDSSPQGTLPGSQCDGSEDLPASQECMPSPPRGSSQISRGSMETVTVQDLVPPNSSKAQFVIDHRTQVKTYLSLSKAQSLQCRSYRTCSGDEHVRSTKWPTCVHVSAQYTL